MRRPACVFGMCLYFMVRLLLLVRPPDTGTYSWLDGKTIEITGSLDNKYFKNNATYLIIDHPTITSYSFSIPDKKIKIKLKEHHQNLSELPVIGAEIRSIGKIMAFQRARNPGNFDQAEYEMIHDTVFEMYGAYIVDIKEDKVHRSVIKRFISYLNETACRFREYLGETAEAIYGKEGSQIIKAMVIGDKNDLSEELKDMYRSAGMSHVLCISGLHISLIGTGLIGLLIRLKVKRRYTYIAAVLFSVGYGFLTGMGVSALRAVIMFMIGLMSGVVKRTPDMITSMSIAGTVIIMTKPLYVLDAGFTLSFAAVAGIGIFSESVNIMVPGKNKVIEAIRASAAITVFMLPVTLYYFYKITVFSVPINVIVIPLLGVLMPSALLSLPAGALCRPLGCLISIPARIILLLYGKLTEINADNPFSVVTVGRPSVIQIILFYAGIVFITKYALSRYKAYSLISGKRNVKMKPGNYLIYYGSLVLLIIMLMFHFRSPLSLTMIDVGQGDCHLIRFPQNQIMMIDCGSSDINEAAKYRVIPYLESEGISSIDYAVITHLDDDHINGYMEILSEGRRADVRIKNLIMPDIYNKDEKYISLCELASRAGTSVKVIHADESFMIDEVGIRCLNPVKNKPYSDINAASVCLEIAYRGFKALYTGDVQEEGEADMMKRLGTDKYTLLKCAHHGSKNSTPESLLKMIRPEVTLISAGVDNSYGHPHKELLERLIRADSRVYVTSNNGAVTVGTNGKKLKIRTFIK
ncbi:MAG: DNA internalization-related competence protein ComEC/Rec2 [Lachnospiraceae bacterium]|nr:DNA internalization-related competence protein ComEC/Rec2 [Lachnospiraceae bacterium]